jgi:hypothetical protein
MPGAAKSPLVKVGAITVALLFVSIFISPSAEWAGFAIGAIVFIFIWQFPAWSYKGGD